jgi:hypothetical protein
MFDTRSNGIRPRLGSAQPFARNPLVGAGLAAEVVHRELLRVSRALHVDDLGVVSAAGPILGLDIIARGPASAAT